ncbi:alpha/beta fold hydrolase [Ramlibacter sp. PS4R-6]|uniref:alpha/beta fold hydrolase n=1 Tax=Ramlibacter sp. PS4R-6 TaxID=3133438 RepID=UPI00309F2AD4
MELVVNGARTYCYTGGKAFDAAKPAVVFVHGVLNDHSVWILQTRHFAHHGFSVLAPDLPGHCRSDGEPPSTVQEAAAFVVALLDAAGVKEAVIVGHSFGSLVAMEVAAHHPRLARKLVMVGTAYPMKVSPLLLNTSRDDPLKAIEIDNVFSHSTLAPPPSALGPGTWLPGASRALKRRVLASNPRVNLFHRGFQACDAYTGGEEAIARVQCPTLFILGERDSMTLPKMARSLQERARNARTVVVHGGHQMMTEAPDEVLAAMKDFLAP